ncbi:helix-hairpin-helix domain-containing protein [Oceanobacillus jeddahense]|uniref:Helix-hairpin-helix domain-containing protein n=1 Tax=Oceanobacillus jeddahense TaxID=1462527 RepID=A0ABY5JQL0_9BACI|nr:helix-hairpin-helix domain-containing protein [Oceanobacillus jeddahense]UUI01448.1 helix-hairpin-helix domain-containing protein [Oceanobacillus jeddahense]
MYWLKKNILIFIVITAVLIFFIFASKKDTSSPLSASLKSSDMDDPIETPLVEEATETQHHTTVVDVKGEVMQPGVYEMEEGDRIRDVIERANGFTENADILQVNLAQVVQDEMIVLIPAVGQEQEENAVNDSTGEQGSKIKINTASSEELTQLPGIGPAKAEAIIAHRDNHGLFQKVEDLLEISGIGEKTLETLMEHIQVP